MNIKNTKTTQHKSLFLVILFLLLSRLVVAQSSYPVSVQVQLYPPHSVYLEDYTSIEKDRFAVTLTLNDQDWPTLDVRLRLSISGGGIELATSENFMATPITLHYGVPLRLTGAELAQYFNPMNMDFQGISKNEFMQNGGKLPEGIFIFRVRVFEARRMVEISNPNPITGGNGGGGSAIAWPTLHNPPMWITPSQNEVVTANDPQNVLLNWLPMHSGGFSVEYEFQIVEIWPENNSPEIVINTITPLYTETLRRTRLVYGPDKPPLEPGKKYACRIKAKDTGGASLFKNQGYSEVLTFTFGKPCKTPLNVTHKDPGKQNVDIQWDAFPDNSSFIVNYREKGQEENEWYEDKAGKSPHTINKLNPGKTYEYKVKALCGTLNSAYSLVKEFKTQELGNVEYDCESNPHIPPIDGSPELEKLNVNDVISIGGFQATVTEVKKGTSGFTGKCTVSTFWIFPILAKFENIKVNQSMQVTSGNIIALKTEIPQGGIIAEGETEDSTTTQSGENIVIDKDTTIIVENATVTSITRTEDEKIIVRYSDGSSHTIIQGNTVSIADANNDQYVVKPDGTVTRNGEPVEVGKEPAEKDKEGQFRNITKICIDKEKEKVIVHDESGETEVEKTPDLEIVDEVENTYLVKDHEVKVKRDTRFWYPSLILKDDCYVVTGKRNTTIDVKVRSICIARKGYTITDDTGKEKFYEDLNVIVTDQEETKFLINDAGNVKIEPKEKTSNETEKKSTEWKKEENCFKLVPVTTASSCEVTYDGDIDFVFKYNNKLHIKDKSNGAIKTIGEIRDLCIKHSDGELSILKEGEDIVFPENNNWDKSKARQLISSNTSGNCIFHNFGVWDFDQLKNLKIEDYMKFPIHVIYLDYIHEQADKEFYNKIIQKLDNYYYPEYSSLLVLYYNRNSELKILKFENGKYDKRDFEAIAEKFSKDFEGVINNNNSGPEAFKELLESLFPLMIEEYSGSGLQKLIFSFTEYIINISKPLDNLDEIIVYKRTKGHGNNSYTVPAYKFKEKEISIDEVLKIIKPFEYIRIGYNKYGSEEAEMFIEAPGVFAYLILTEFEKNKSISKEIEAFASYHGLNATGTTSKFNFTKLFETLNTYHSNPSNKNFTINRKDYQDFTNEPGPVSQKLEGFNEIINLEMTVGSNTIGSYKFVEINNYDYKFSIEYYGIDKKLILRIECKTIIDLFTLALKIGISEDEQISGLLDLVKTNLLTLTEGKKYDEIDVILSLLSEEILKIQTKFSLKNKIDFLKVICMGNVDNFVIDEEAIVIKIIKSFKGTGEEGELLKALSKDEFLKKLLYKINGTDKLLLGKEIYELWLRSSDDKKEWKLYKNEGSEEVLLSGNGNIEIKKYEVYPPGPDHKLYEKYSFTINENSSEVIVKIHNSPLDHGREVNRLDFDSPVLLCFTKMMADPNATTWLSPGIIKEQDGIIVPAIYAYCYNYNESYEQNLKFLGEVATMAGYAFSIYGIYAAETTLWKIILSVKLAGDIALDVFKLTDTQDPFAKDFIAFWEVLTTAERAIDAAQLVKALGSKGLQIAKRGIRYYKFRNVKVKAGIPDVNDVKIERVVDNYGNSEVIKVSNWTQGEVDEMTDYLGYGNLRKNEACNFNAHGDEIIIKYGNDEIYKIVKNGPEIPANSTWSKYNLTEDQSKWFLNELNTKPENIQNFIDEPDLLNYWKIISKNPSSSLRTNIDNLKTLKKIDPKITGANSLENVLDACNSKQKFIDALNKADISFGDNIKYKIESVSGYGRFEVINDNEVLGKFITNPNGTHLEIEPSAIKTTTGTTSKELTDLEIRGKDSENLTGKVTFESKDGKVWFRKIVNENFRINPKNIREAAQNWNQLKKARFNLADDFYKNVGYSDYDNHLRGIDFEKEVKSIRINKGEYIYQYCRVDKNGEIKLGSYFFKNKDVNINKLGFDIEDKVLVRVKLEESSNFLQSSIADIEDWVPGSNKVFQGGETQLFNPNTRLTDISIVE